MAVTRMRSLLSRGRDRVQSVAEPERPRRYNLVPGVGIISHLPLQMGLYFNVYFSPFWVVGMAITLQAKFSQLEDHYKIVTTMVLLVMTLIEALRLFLGYEGNLREKVPELAGFWLLSLFQLPLVVYLIANTNTLIVPLEWSISFPLIIFLLFEIGTGLRALQLMTQAQAIKYQLSQMHPWVELKSSKLKADVREKSD